MKLTKTELNQIIREELAAVLMEADLDLLEEGWKDWAMGLGMLGASILPGFLAKPVQAAEPAAAMQQQDGTIQSWKDLQGGKWQEQGENIVLKLIGKFSHWESDKRDLAVGELVNWMANNFKGELSKPLQNAINVVIQDDKNPHATVQQADYLKDGRNFLKNNPDIGKAGADVKKATPESGISKYRGGPPTSASAKKKLDQMKVAQQAQQARQALKERG